MISNADSRVKYIQLITRMALVRGKSYDEVASAIADEGEQPEVAITDKHESFNAVI